MPVPKNRLYDVTKVGLKTMQMYHDNVAEYVKIGDELYPVSRKYVVGEFTEDFQFVINSSTYTLSYQTGENLNFTIDWGDGTETKVTGTTTSQRTHTYSSSKEWTITIKNYVSGWLHFEGDTKLIKVLTPFPPSTTKTSFRACFYNCTLLESIPDYLFARCPNAQIFGVRFTDSGASDRGCFHNCTALKYLPPKLFAKCYNATMLGRCFSNCSGIEEIPYGFFDDCINCTEFAACFNSCTNLTSVSPRLFKNCHSAVSMYYLFAYCSKLAFLPSALFEGCTTVTDMKGCFVQCDSITQIPNMLFKDLISVTDFGYCFYACDGLIKIPSKLFFNCSKVVKMEECFNSCINIKEIEDSAFEGCGSEIDSSETAITWFNCFSGVRPVYVGKRAFARSNISSVYSSYDLPSTMFRETVEIGDEAFAECHNLTQASFESNYGYKLIKVGRRLFANCLKMTQTRSFNYGLFDGNKLIEEVPEDIFEGCINITSVNGCFRGCTNLKKVGSVFKNLPNLEDAGYTFESCTGLETIGKDIFKGCSKLTKLTNCFRASGLTKIPPDLFEDCPNIIDFQWAFQYCTSIKGKVPAFWVRTTPDLMSYRCFYGCTQVDNYAAIPAAWK